LAGYPTVVTSQDFATRAISKQKPTFTGSII
jgi:hypothetical protein